MRLLIIASLSGVVLCAQAALGVAPIATVGAYYFEGWYHDTPQAVAAFANAELRNEFPEREPIWGGGLWRGDTVQIMEQQIDLAADHGISFFNFHWYWYGSPSVTMNDGINSGLANFMQASNRDRMKFNINIVDVAPTAIASDTEWEQVADMLMPYLADSQYLRVGGNPLVTIFNSDGMTQRNYAYFQLVAASSGIEEIEFAANVAGVTSRYTHVTHHSAVPGWGAGEVEYPYQSLTEYVEGNDTWSAGVWNTEIDSTQSYIPMIMAGFDARPWNTPPTWYFNPTRTPHAVGRHLQNAVDWIDDHPQHASDERLVMIYSWNEFGEGGYIVPTIGDPDGLYLDAIQSVLIPEPSIVPGDANRDGLVNVSDLGVVGANFNRHHMRWGSGDFNQDHVTDVADLGILGANWTGSGHGISIFESSHAVPEPAALFCLIAGVLNYGLRRRSFPRMVPSQPGHAA